MSPEAREAAQECIGQLRILLEEVDGFDRENIPETHRQRLGAVLAELETDHPEAYTSLCVHLEKAGHLPSGPLQ